MSTVVPSTFTVDSTMEITSDRFSLSVPGSVNARAAARSDRFTIKAGLKDGGNVAQFVTQMSGAFVDEYEIKFTPDAITESLRGRDAGATILDTSYKKNFLRSPAPTPITTAPLPSGVPSIPTEYGRWSASAIASQAVASVGLSLSWGAPDYELLANYNANGRIIDILHDLLKPWSLVAPYKVDVYVTGSTVVVSSRQTLLSGGPGYTTAMAAFRRSTITIRKRPSRLFGLITLKGELVPQSNIDNNGTPTPRSKNFSVTYPAKTRTGGFASSVAYDAVYRQPDNVLTFLQTQELTPDENGNPTLSKLTTTRKEWTDTVYDAKGRAITPALELSEIVSVQRVDPSDDTKQLREWEVETTFFSYDNNNFLAQATTIKQALNLDAGTLENLELVIKDIIPTAPLLNDQTTTLYRWLDNGSGVLDWIFQRQDIQPQGGHKPGGPGRGNPQSVLIPNPDPKQNPIQTGPIQIVLAQQINPAGTIGAIDFTYSNPNLSLAQLSYIMAQFVAANNIFEYEILFTGVGMPWLKKGTTLQITGVVLEDGVSTITLPLLLLTEVRTTYDESKPAAEYTSVCRAFGWAVS